MNVTIRYKQPLFFQDQVQKTTDHVIPCHDSETFPNGMPKPLESHANWNSTFQAIEKLAHYERIS